MDTLPLAVINDGVTTAGLPQTAIGLAIGLAFASAAATSISASLQHRAASKAPAAKCGGIVAVMLYLIRQPMWLIGLPISACAVTLHTIALKYGTLSTVQPIMVTGVVMAVVVRAGFDRRLIRRAELTGVLLAALGLGGFLVLAHGQHARVWAEHQDAVLPTAIALSLIGVVLGYRRWGRPSKGFEAYLMATAAGLCFGTLDSLLKVSTDLVAVNGLGHTLLAWPLVALCLFGIGGVMLNQRAYQVAPISVAMPVVNITNILVAVTFAWLVYAQPPSGSAHGLVGQVLCLALAAHGLRRIAIATGCPEMDSDGPAGAEPSKVPVSVSSAA